MKKILAVLFCLSLTVLAGSLTACQQHEHSFAETLSYNETGHWYAATCEHTEEKSCLSFHTFGEWQTVTEATCGAAGEEKRSCSCGYTETRTTEQKPHTSFGEWQTVTEATCATAGEEKRSCSCGYTETRTTEQKPHTSFGNWQTVTEATCGAEGEEKRSCSCGYYETRKTDKLPHSFATTYTYNETEHWYAATCEHTEEKKALAPHTFGQWETTKHANPGIKGEEKCSCVCGYYKTRETDPIPGSVGLKYTENRDGTYTISGIGTCTDTGLIIPNTYNGKRVASIGREAFSDCYSLTSVVIPDNVTFIGDSAFSNCISLRSVVVPNGVTSIGNFAFYYCESLTSVTIPDSVTSIGNFAFGYCYKLTSVTIGSKVSSIGDFAFYSCFNLTSVTVPDSVTSIGDSAFYNCTSLTSVIIPDSVTSIGDSAFSGLTSVYYNGTKSDWGNITIGNYNTDLTSAIRYYYSETQPTAVGNYWHYDENGVPTAWESSQYSQGLRYTENVDGTLTVSRIGSCMDTDIVIPDTHNDKIVTAIGEEAFRSCSNLTSVTIPDSVTFIGNFAFYYCTSLKSVAIPDSVTSIGYQAFEYCYSLTSVTIPDGVTSIAFGTFCYCTSLTSIVIPDSVTSIGGDAFYECTSLTSVIIPDGVASIGKEAFHRCTSLTSVSIGNGVTSIGERAFSHCTSLTNISVSANNATYQSIDGNLYTKDGKTLVQYAVGKTDTSFTIPSGVTSIGESAFYLCISLKSVVIPDGVTSIGQNAFDGCSSLRRVYYGGTESDWSKITIGYYNTLLTSATRYYYSETRPTNKGKYWHYDEEGNPVVWE